VGLPRRAWHRGAFTVLHQPVRVYVTTAAVTTAAVIAVNITKTAAYANSCCRIFADDLAITTLISGSHLARPASLVRSSR
jgi:hypothetical protein